MLGCLTVIMSVITFLEAVKVKPGVPNLSGHLHWYLVNTGVMPDDFIPFKLHSPNSICYQGCS